MAMYSYIRKAWKRPKENKELWTSRLIKWRKEPVTVRVERPTRLDRARNLGYKAKEGFVIVRQRVSRGGRKREMIKAGRRPKHNRALKILNINYQQVAEQRANAKYKNCEVLNSYYVAKDGQNYWYEIILVDTANPNIVKDKDINWICSNKQKGRVLRGLTSSGRKGRGLRHKGTGAEKVRSSRNAVTKIKLSKPRKD